MNDNTDYTGVEKSPLVKIVELQAELDRTCKELDRWKTMVQRHNPSGCCCQIDENNGDPQMVEPCAFHAEWRDTVLEALRGKVQRFKSIISSLGGIATLNIELLEAYSGLCDVSHSADIKQVATESVTQPKIDFCYACGTALGVE